MDVRRLQLWEDRNASLLCNDSIQCVIEDRGGMVLELSNVSAAGGRVNAHPLYWFRGTGGSLEAQADQAFWQRSTLLYQLAGNFLCFPNFGGPHECSGVSHDAHGWTANRQWTVVKYGTDAETGANWLLSSMVSPAAAYPVRMRKLDMMLPGHPVLYSSVVVENTGLSDLPANIAWHNTVGSPFLESGCIVNLCADAFMTVVGDSEFRNTARLAFGKEFSDLAKAPLATDGTCDLTMVPGPIGYTDFITGAVPSASRLGWSSVLNPRLQMLYVSFFPGPAALGPDDFPLYFTDLWMQYGGRRMSPWALYEGGMDQTLCLGAENATAYFAQGLEQSLVHPQLLGHPTHVMLPAGAKRVLRYGTAFSRYDNQRMSAGVQSVEQVVEGLVLKRGKAWAFIEADSTFHFLKQLESRLLDD